MATQTYQDQAAATLLQEACARNTAAEIRFEWPDGEEAIGRTRLLAFESERLIADVPRYPPGAKRIPPNRKVRVLLQVSGKRYEFASAIIETDVRFQLNRQARVRGISLRVPQRVDESQRRASFRISLLQAEIQACVVEPHPKLATCCAIDAQRRQATIINLSAGGVGLLLDSQGCSHLKADKRLYVSFQLPDVEGEFHMLAVVRHIVAVPSSGQTRVGMAFAPWPGINLAAEKQRITRYLAAHERRLLQRRK